MCYAPSLGDCLGPSLPYAFGSGIATEASPGLSGLPETAFAVLIGTAPERASSLDDTIRVVHVRANYNANNAAHGGKLPLKPTEYYSRELVADVIGMYRKLSGTGTVVHVTEKTVSTDAGRDVYEQVTTHLIPSYPAIRAATVQTILREFLYAVVDKRVPADLLLPAVARYPTPGSGELLSTEEQRRENNEKAAKLEESTFWGRLGSGFLGLFSAPGKLIDAATTTATIAGVGVVVVGLGLTALIGYGVYRKITQFDVNRGYRTQHETIRRIGPATAAAIVRKGR